jgi:hypothetical protein
VPTCHGRLFPEKDWSLGPNCYLQGLVRLKAEEPGAGPNGWEISEVKMEGVEAQWASHQWQPCTHCVLSMQWTKPTEKTLSSICCGALHLGWWLVLGCCWTFSESLKEPEWLVTLCPVGLLSDLHRAYQIRFLSVWVERVCVCVCVCVYVCMEGKKGQIGPSARALGILKQGEKPSCLPSGGLSWTSMQVTLSLPSDTEDLHAKRGVL